LIIAEGQVLGRCARAGLDQGAPWLDTVLAPLWKNTSVAPGGAKTMPSRSAAIALGRALEEMPNASAISAMREVISTVRHAGIKKKLSRMLRTAERRLADRPDLFLRLPSGHKVDPDERSRRCVARWKRFIAVSTPSL